MLNINALKKVVALEDQPLLNNVTAKSQTNIQNNFEKNNSLLIFNKLKVWQENRDSYQDGNKYNYLVAFAGALNRYGVNKTDAVKFLVQNYQNAANYVNDKDFEKIVEDVYFNYSNQFNTSSFEDITTTEKEAISSDLKQFSDEVYNNLPLFFKDCIKPFDNKPAKDIYLTGLLTLFSGVLPTILR